MTLYFVFKTFADIREGVQVFQLRLGTKFLLTIWTKGNIGIHTHRSFFHLDIRNACVLDDFFESCQISVGFFRRTHIGFRYNLDQWHPLTVKVNIRETVCSMRVLTGIFFQVGTFNPDFLSCSVFQLHFNPTVITDWLVKLRNLVGFWIIRIEVVLTVKVHVLVDIHIQRQSGLDSSVHNTLVQDRKYPWERPVDHISIGILLVPKVSRGW